MIKIEIKIEEKAKQEYKTTKSTLCEIETTEKGINATEGEIKTSKIIKDRLKVDQKLQIENLSKTKSKDEVLEELLKAFL